MRNLRIPGFSSKIRFWHFSENQSKRSIIIESEIEKERLHICNFCDYSGKSILDLKTHIEIHQDVLPIAVSTQKMSKASRIYKPQTNEQLKCQKENCNFETAYFKKLEAHLKCKFLYDLYLLQDT